LLRVRLLDGLLALRALGAVLLRALAVAGVARRQRAAVARLDGRVTRAVVLVAVRLGLRVGRLGRDRSAVAVGLVTNRGRARRVDRQEHARDGQNSGERDQQQRPAGGT